MANTRPSYPPEYRAEAVRLVREGGRNPYQATAGSALAIYGQSAPATGLTMV